MGKSAVVAWNIDGIRAIHQKRKRPMKMTRHPANLAAKWPKEKRISFSWSLRFSLEGKGWTVCARGGCHNE